MQSITLKVEVPIACFRQSRAREYAETYPVPPPATVYGMLLSMVGEIDRYQHCGCELAIALISEPQISRVIRTFRRVKKQDIHDPTNARPDYQELLTDIRFMVWVATGNEPNKPSLANRLYQAFINPATVNRFGGLCLGESRDLVNVITPVKSGEVAEPLRWLVQNEDGLLTLPYWVDHVGSKGTRWRRYDILEPANIYQPPDMAWTAINFD